MRAAWVVGTTTAATTLAVACSTFSSTTDSPSGDGGAPDAAVPDAPSTPDGEVDAGPDANGPLCGDSDYSTFTLGAFNEDAPIATVDGGVLSAVADVGDGGLGRARYLYETPPNTYALELDYDLEIAGVDDVDIEAGCIVVVHHPDVDTASPYTELYLNQEPSRAWLFKIDQTPPASTFVEFKKQYTSLDVSSAPKTRVHLKLDLRNGRAAGYATWAGVAAKFDQVLGRPVDAVELYCGVDYVNFNGSSAKNVALRISSFTGYLCAP